MRRPLIIFYFLVVYALAELIWWGVLLVQSQPARSAMIIGEGAVFVILLFYGAYRLHKAINEEAALHQQQKNFLLSVTHELKSPLSSIKLYLQTILRRELSAEKQRAFLLNSLKDIERLDDLVENMLIATKIENKSYTFPKERFDFSTLAEEVLQRIRQNLPEKERLQARIDGDIPVYGDRFALSLALSNLVENALKYSPPAAAVHLELKEAGPKAVLRVADQGQGIPDKEKEKIFDKFYRIGSEETRATKGTGLGLFIVKQVLDNHGAVIQVKDNRPAGTIFEILIDRE
ncbi:phospho-acceptor domain-containing protein [Anseongella ginsenosidimutans]|uniref:histidine kinase n=1 Tax=Anseongella ginsenosidimutans TaxID=496056 RepID=A0A4V2UTI5_9SPHI|nr:HAMP domain-containing sensor histidine kinase [Anseongella ginsenosidimutans]QEC54333.1 HAMP domain-containing histidine kinase [Anseongella ginsenosidimutans]TCS86214.1 phospho-acceptor domain-containing protein [Anseongella ginsenosidimutans]